MGTARVGAEAIGEGDERAVLLCNVFYVGDQSLDAHGQLMWDRGVNYERAEKDYQCIVWALYTSLFRVMLA